MVCLGWIPNNRRKTWEEDSVIQTTKVEIEGLEDGQLGHFDTNSGFYFSTDDDDELFLTKKVTDYNIVEGYLRKAESPNYLLSRFNSDREGVVNQIDVKRMVGFFRF